ncbi:MAG: NADH/ubiquinone/plastoquinone (complex I), partial [Alphaproteobacteria bacterium]|nr:NADH/ubiquinone/plastoquinone (complex I) [Alphaproteobacteria bacterium]
PSLLALAPVPAFAAALLTADGTTLVLPEPPFRMTLTLDEPGGLLLGVAALLWILGGIYASVYLRDDPSAARFAEWWLLTLAGSMGVFIAADLVSFYLTYSVVSLAAYGLIVHDATPGSRRAGIIYVALAVLGEAFLLMAFVFMAATTPDGSFLIRDAVAALPNSPWRNTALILLILGFGLKIGLAPLHVWMPLAYTAAPIPAAAVLSGAAVKAGVIGFIRFLPLGAATPEWGQALAAAGLFSAFYGVLVGITQQNPKTVLAYSSVSQMGLLAAGLGIGLAVGDSGAVFGTSFSAAHHVLVKGGLFLAIGVAGITGARPWPVLIPAGVLALGLAGLPLTGGSLAKLAVKAQFSEGVVGWLATLSAAGSALLMFHFLRCLAAAAPERADATTPARYRWAWLIAAFAAVAVPWLLYPAAGSGPRLEALAPATVWAALWPVLAGGSLAAALWRWGARLPHIPEGDVVVLGETAAGATARWAEALERGDAHLRQWPVASLLLMVLVIVLGAAMLRWG